MKKVVAAKAAGIDAEDRVMVLVESIRVLREKQAELKKQVEAKNLERKTLEGEENDAEQEIVKLWASLDKPKSIRRPGTTLIVSPLDDSYAPQSDFENISDDYVIKQEVTTIKYKLNLEKISEYVSKYRHTPKGIVAFMNRHKVTIKNQ